MISDYTFIWNEIAKSILHDFIEKYNCSLTLFLFSNNFFSVEGFNCTIKQLSMVFALN